jgi:ATP-dependent exoDNAse (exonuclease V) beta subunit
MFDLDLIEFQELDSVTTDNGRFYTTPDGKVLPSVTTILGRTKDQTHLNEWKERLGAKAAEFESQRAANRGSAMHNLCEKLVLNQPYNLRDEMPVSVQLFSQLRPILQERVNNIRAVEAPLYSEYLGVAGRVDLVADYEGKRSIIDYKSSNNVKKLEWIEDYCLQTSMYAVMFEERTGLPVNQLVIMIGNENSPKPSVFVQKRNDWIYKAIDRVNLYKNSLPYF